MQEEIDERERSSEVGAPHPDQRWRQPSRKSPPVVNLQLFGKCVEVRVALLRLGDVGVEPIHELTDQLLHRFGGLAEFGIGIGHFVVLALRGFDDSTVRYGTGRLKNTTNHDLMTLNLHGQLPFVFLGPFEKSQRGLVVRLAGSRELS